MDRHIKHALAIHASLYPRGSAICTFMRFSAHQAALGVENIVSQWVIALWADDVVGSGRGPGSLGKVGWEKCVAIGFLFLRVSGVCLDAYLKSRTLLCSSVCMWHASRQEQCVPGHANRQEQCASICSPDMFCVIAREAISLVIR